MAGASHPNDGDSTDGVAHAMERVMGAIIRWASRPTVQADLAGERGIVMTSPKGWLLDRIVTLGPTRMSELAGWLHIDKSTLTPHITRLERDGLVQRRPDPEDRRGVLVEATADGRRALRTAVGAGRSRLAELFGEWDETDRDEFSRLLVRFAASLDEAAD